MQEPAGIEDGWKDSVETKTTIRIFYIQQLLSTVVLQHKEAASPSQVLHVVLVLLLLVAHRRTLTAGDGPAAGLGHGQSTSTSFRWRRSQCCQGTCDHRHSYNLGAGYIIFSEILTIWEILDFQLCWILTAALSEDGGAAEFEEPLCIEAGSVHRHGVLLGWCRWMRTQRVSVRAAGLVVNRLVTVS